MFGLIDNLARRLIRRALRRGILEGNVVWAVVGGIAIVLRLVTRADKEKVVRTRLKLGEQITVRHLPAPPTRRERRRQAKVAAITRA